MDILKIENVTKKFVAHTALDNISLSIPKGSIYGLLGPNGAGKTTLIRIINRITAPDSGKVWFDGREIAPQDVANIGYLPEERGLYKKMKVGEQAIFFAMLKGLSRKEATARLKEWFIRFEIEGWWGKKVEELSKGMAQKVQFIVTVLHNPPLLILDEPFSGFDPINTRIIKEEILRLRNEGATIIFSTHDMPSVEEICDHMTLINRSRNILSGEVNKIRHSHGSNIFEVDFRGEMSALVAGIEDKCAILSRDDNGMIYNTLKLQVDSDDKVRGVIDYINQRVEIRSFKEIVPSMSDIFIKAVADENRKQDSNSVEGLQSETQQIKTSL